MFARVNTAKSFKTTRITGGPECFGSLNLSFLSCESPFSSIGGSRPPVPKPPGSPSRRPEHHAGPRLPTTSSGRLVPSDWSCCYRRRSPLAVWARQHLGSNWSSAVTIKQGHELITTGPYALVRHPIYTGILTGFLGTAIALSQVRGVIGFVLIFLMLGAKLRMEEKWMHSQFGETYATYAQQTDALVPYLF